MNVSESAGIDQSAALLLGITVVQKLLERCAIRDESKRTPVFCIVDECQEVASVRIPVIVNTHFAPPC